MTILLLKTHFRTESEGLELHTVSSEHLITLQSPAQSDLGSRGTANIPEAGDLWGCGEELRKSVRSYENNSEEITPNTGWI